MDSIFPSWVTDIASGVSIISFFISVYALFEISKVKETFTQKGRMPNISNDLEKLSKSFLKHVETYEESKDLLNADIKKFIALLEANTSHIAKENKSKIEEFINKQKNITHPVSKDTAWNIYGELSGIVTYTKEINKNFRWK